MQLVEKKWDLQNIYNLAREAMEAGDVAQALKLSQKGLTAAQSQVDTEWEPKFQHLNQEIQQETTPPPEVAAIFKPKADLTKIKGIGPTHAVTLQKAGYKTIEQIAHASPKILTEVKGIGLTTAQKFIASAKEYLGIADTKPILKEPSNPSKSTHYQTFLATSTSALSSQAVVPEATIPKRSMSKASNLSQTVSVEEPSEAEDFLDEDIEKNIPIESKISSKPIIQESIMSESEKQVPKRKSFKQLAKAVLSKTKPEIISPVDVPMYTPEKISLVNELAAISKDEEFHIAPQEEFHELFSLTDLTVFKLIPTDRSHVLLICPILVNHTPDTVIISEQNAYYQVKKKENEQLGQDSTHVKQIQQLIVEDIIGQGTFSQYLQQYFMTQMDVDHSISQDVSLYAQGQQFRLYIDPIIIHPKEILFVEKSIPFAYQKHNNIHFIHKSQLSSLLNYLEQKYQTLMQFSNEPSPESIFYYSRDEFQKRLRFFSFPLVGFGALVFIIALSQLGFLFTTFIGLSYALLGVYGGSLGYLFYKHRLEQRALVDKLSAPHYQKIIDMDDTSLELISQELQDEFMLQFGYECFGKHSSHPLLDTLEKAMVEETIKHTETEHEEEYTELFEQEQKPKSPDISDEYTQKYSAFLDD